MSATWRFRRGRRVAHARLDYTATKAPCGQSLANTKQVSSYDPTHVGINPCRVCLAILQRKGGR